MMNRGHRREAIFRDEQVRRMFLAALTEACGKTQWQIQAYGLMRHHFHLVLETPQANLVAGMKWLLGVTEARRREDLAREFKPVERGWCLGSEEFRQELLASAAGWMRAGHYGAERREAQESTSPNGFSEGAGTCTRGACAPQIRTPPFRSPVLRSKVRWAWICSSKRRNGTPCAAPAKMPGMTLHHA